MVCSSLEWEVRTSECQKISKVVIFGLQLILFLEFHNCNHIGFCFSYRIYILPFLCLPGFNKDKSYMKASTLATDLGVSTALRFATDLGFLLLTNWETNITTVINILNVLATNTSGNWWLV